MLTQERLKELVTYDKDTGLFHWRFSRPGAKKGGECGCVHKGTGYVCLTIDRVLYLAHRLAFLYVEGEFPKEHVAHSKGNRSDNRWSSLSHTSTAQNAMDRSIPSNNTSGVMGVIREGKYANGDTKWVSRIKAEGKYLRLYFGRDFDEACRLRWEAEIKYNYHEDHGKR